MPESVEVKPAPSRPEHLGPLRDAVQFLGMFVRAPATVGAILPSSRFLARVLTFGLELAPGDAVLEYGPGTGPITGELARWLPPGVRYLGIEREPGFVRRLQQRFPALTFHLGSVEDVARIVDAHGLPQPKVIVSGLPFASLPEPVQQRVVDGTALVLRADGEFRTFQYVHAYGLPAAQRFRRAMRRRFTHFERSRPVLRNLPPAFVLGYRK